MTRISLMERGKQIQRKLATGVRLPGTDAMRNSGRRRTEEKRGLLARIRDIAAGKGEAAPFEASF